MPVHDWSRVEPGLFHHFHQDWSVEITRTLNAGLLPKGYYALVEQRVGGQEPDVIAVESGRGKKTKPERGGTMVLSQPRTRMGWDNEPESVAYARKANRITVRHPLEAVVAVIEIVAPGNKANRAAVRAFVQKAVEFLFARVHLLVIDLFPPTRRDLEGLNKAIWDEFAEAEFELPKDEPLTLAGFDAGPPQKAYVETVGVGDPLPSMPVFLARGLHVLVPLEATYAATWAATPEPIRELVAPPRRRK